MQQATLVDDLIEGIKRARINPNWFCEEILQSPNDPWQAHGMDAIADIYRLEDGLPTLYNHKGLNRFTIASWRGPGKTHWMAKVIHWFNYIGKGRIPCAGPKEEQIKTRLWPEFRLIAAGAVLGYKQLFNVQKTSIEWCNDPDWVALVESAGQSENLSGHHFKRLAFLVDEASGVKEEMFVAIEGSLTEDGAILVLIGNPTRTSGEFWASHNKKNTKELYYQIKIRHEDSNRINKVWVAGMIKKYGRNSPAVKVHVFGEFVDMEENQLIALEWIMDAIGKKFDEEADFPKKRVTIDVSDGGEDETVTVVGYHYMDFLRLVKLKRYSFEPSVAPIDSANAGIRVYEGHDCDAKNGDDIVPDSIGVGAGTAGYLIKKKKYNIITYKGGESSDDTKQWRNRRVQSHICLRDAFRDGKITIDEDFCESREDWDDFIAQLTSIKSKVGTERIEDLETKKEMKARGIKSPDMAEACVMQYATQAPQTFVDNTPIEIFGQAQSVNYDHGLS